MKKHLLLKFVALAMLCYVAIMPSTNVNANCGPSECVTLTWGNQSDVGCAEYYGVESYTRGCKVLFYPNPDGTWHNFCSTGDC
jgi:hypothetical protein